MAYQGYTPAQGRASRKYSDANYVRLYLNSVRVEKKAEIQAAAKAAGESMAEYIMKSVEERMAREKK